MTSEWKGEERRGSNFNVKQAILKGIDAEDDAKARNLLMLIFGVIESMEHGFGRLEKKIDLVLKDEATIKKTVLNGHVDAHHKHHDWVESQMRHNCADVCEWVNRKMKEEEDAQKDNAKYAREKMWNFAEKVLYGVAGMAIYALLNGWKP